VLQKSEEDKVASQAAVYRGVTWNKIIGKTPRTKNFLSKKKFSLSAVFGGGSPLSKAIEEASNGPKKHDSMIVHDEVDEDDIVREMSRPSMVNNRQASKLGKKIAGNYLSQKQIDVTKVTNTSHSTTFTNFMSPTFDVSAFVNDGDEKSESERSVNSEDGGMQTLAGNKNFKEFIGSLKNENKNSGAIKRRSLSFLNEDRVKIINDMTGSNSLSLTTDGIKELANKVGGLGVDVGADGKNLVKVDGSEWE